jgi:hypothetical protein
MVLGPDFSKRLLASALERPVRANSAGADCVAGNGYESEQSGCPQSQEISTSAPESLQRWLQYFVFSATVHWHAGWAHFFVSVFAII